MIIQDTESSSSSHLGWRRYTGKKKGMGQAVKHRLPLNSSHNSSSSFLFCVICDFNQYRGQLTPILDALARMCCVVLVVLISTHRQGKFPTILDAGGGKGSKILELLDRQNSSNPFMSVLRLKDISIE